MSKKSVLTLVFCLAASVITAHPAHAIGRSKLELGNDCRTQSKGSSQCIPANKPCSIIASLLPGRGISIRNKEVSFGVGGGTPQELGYGSSALIRRTNSAGKVKITLNPSSKTKGRNGTVVLMPYELGAKPAFGFSQLDFKICE